LSTIVVYLSPAFISLILLNVTFSDFNTLTKLSVLDTLVPFDNWPYVLSPIAYAVPSSVNITIWFVPSSNSIILSGISICSLVFISNTLP